MSSEWTRRGFVASAIASAAYVSVGRAASGERIKIGQIGAVHAHAGGKMEAMRGLSELFEVVGVVPSPGRPATGKTYDGLKVMTEDELLNTPGLRAVAVETEVRDLMPTALRCVSRGLHVHHDKPGGESLSEYRHMREVAAANKAIVQMGYMLRYNPGMNLLYKAVRERWLGEVFTVHAEMSKRSDGERKHLAEYRGGMMFELGGHVLDSIVYMFGKPEKVTPFVRASHLKDDTLNDNMLAVLEWPRMTATVKCSLIDFAGGPRRQMVLSGTEGTAELRPLEPPSVQLTLSEARGGFKKGVNQPELVKQTGRYDAEFADFAAVIRGEKPLAWTAEHDVAVQDTILRASGMPV